MGSDSVSEMLSYGAARARTEELASRGVEDYLVTRDADPTLLAAIRRCAKGPRQEHAISELLDGALVARLVPASSGIPRDKRSSSGLTVVYGEAGLRFRSWMSLVKRIQALDVQVRVEYFPDRDSFNLSPGELKWYALFAVRNIGEVHAPWTPPSKEVF